MLDPARDRIARTAGAAVILAAAFALAVVPLLPTGAPSESPVDAFSASRAMEHVERIAVEPRPIGSPGNERARAAILSELRRLGLEPEVQQTEAPDWFGSSGDGTVDVANVLARIPGSDPVGAVAVVAHIDTPPTSPGANDDAAMVAAILEVARAILAGPELRDDVLLLFTDGEEPTPRFGATAFVARHPWADDIAALVNLEAIGGTGPALVIAAAGSDETVLGAYAAAVDRPAAFSFLKATRDLIGGSTSDFDVFREAGLTGVEIGYLRGSPIYHTALDTPERVDPGSLQHVGDSTLALVREMAGSPGSGPGEPMAYHSIGRALIGHPIAWVPAIAILAVLGLVVAGVIATRSGRSLRLRVVGRSVAGAVLALVASVVAGSILWALLAGVRNDLDVVESYVYLGGLVALAVIVHAAIRRSIGRSWDGWSAAIAAALVWSVLALPLAVAVPGLGYLFAWPLLAVAVALLLRGPARAAAGSAGTVRDLVAFAIVAVTTLVLMVPAIDTFFQLAQPRTGNRDSELLWIVAVPMLLITLSVELLAAVRPRTAPTVVESAVGPAGADDA